MKIISTRKSEKIVVDDDIYEKFGDKKWYISSKGYAARNFGSTGYNNIKYLHRLIMGEPTGMVIDHINGDKLDNRRCNLRICSNRTNVRMRHNDVRGYHWDKARKLYKVEANGRYIGRYQTKEEALRAYLKAKAEDARKDLCV